MFQAVSSSGSRAAPFNGEPDYKTFSPPRNIPDFAVAGSALAVGERGGSKNVRHPRQNQFKSAESVPERV